MNVLTLTELVGLCGCWLFVVSLCCVVMRIIGGISVDRLINLSTIRFGCQSVGSRANNGWWTGDQLWIYMSIQTAARCVLMLCSGD